MRTLGLIVNPIAGIGGAVALKGSDGAETVRLALARGAVPHASERAEAALRLLAPSLGGFRLLVAPGLMGEAAARAAGLDPEVLSVVAGDTNAAARADTAIGTTTSADTREAARRMLAAGVDLILFAGGDGTARDIYDALVDPAPAAGPPAPTLGDGGRPHDLVPVIGIPAGCKIHSAVYAATPAAAGELARRYAEGAVTRFADFEVMDIDEEAFRAGEVRARLYGFLRVPDDRRLMQGAKVGGRGLTDAAAAQSIAERVVEGMQGGRLYLIGPGTTTRAIKDRLGLEGTLLGVDAVRDGRLVARDATEAELLALLLPGQQATIVVTVIGGQGYIFGRGNQQLSPVVIRRIGVKNVVVAATQEKLTALSAGRLRVDTGDEELDALLRGYRRVVTGYAEEAVLRVE